MGADLYIEKVNKVCQNKWKPIFDEMVAKRDKAKAYGDKEKEEAFQKEVSKAYNGMYAEGYFRDAYNGSNVLWTLGLSWWEDITKLQNKKGNISGKNLRKFLEMVEKANQKMPDAAKLSQGMCEAKTKEQVQGWHDYFKKSRQELIDFIKLAIKEKTYINASL